AELLQRVSDDLEVDIDLLLGAIQAGIDVPGAEILVLLNLLEDRVGGGTRLADVVRAAHAGGCSFPDGSGDHHGVGDDLGQAQRTNELDDLGDIGLFGELDLERLEHRRLGHQPEAHLGADAVVGLGEHAVQGRTVAPLEHLPGVVALHAAHTGAVDVTVGQDHFHAALHHEVLAVWGVTHAAVHGVAQRAGNRRRRGEGQHQRDVVFLQVVIQLTVGHAGLDQGGTQLSVDVKDLVHLLQVEDDLTTLPRGGGAITEVAAGGDGPDR